MKGKLWQVVKIAVTVFVIFLSVMGCNAGNSTVNTSLQKKQEKVKITVWTNNRHDMDVRKKQVERYNAENKDNIEIDYEIKADDFENVLKLAFMSNTAPDIAPTYPSLSVAVKNGWLRPIDEDLVQEYKEKFMPGAIKRFALDNKAYSVNAGYTIFKFIWNKDLFRECGLDPDKPPKYWSEVREYAKVITSKGKGVKYGFSLPIKDNSVVRVYVMIPGAPSGLYNSDGYDPRTGKFDFSIYKPMLQFYKELLSDGSLFPTPATLNYDNARAQFAEGNIGMMLGASWDVGVLNDQFPAKIDWGVADFPTFDGVKGGYPASVGGTNFAMSAFTQDKDKQLKVWQWLISDDVLKELSLAGKGPYSLKSLNQPEFINKDKKGALEFSTPTKPIHLMDMPENRPSNFLQIDGVGYAEVFTKIITNDGGIDSGIEGLNKKYNEAFRNFTQEDMDISQFIIPDFDPTTYQPK